MTLPGADAPETGAAQAKGEDNLDTCPVNILEVDTPPEPAPMISPGVGVEKQRAIYQRRDIESEVEREEPKVEMEKKDLTKPTPTFKKEEKKEEFTESEEDISG